MCGIFAYFNCGVLRKKIEVASIIIEGLRKLEYRGYDSAGMAIEDENGIEILKQIGPVSQLAKLVDSALKNPSETSDASIAFGHTRWATHGAIENINSHPHYSSEKKEFVVIHNGIITNFKHIKSMLEAQNYEFLTKTDTEVLVKLALYFYRELSGIKVSKNHVENPANGNNGLKSFSMDDIQPVPFQVIALRIASVIEGASAFVLMSKYYPNELCAFRRGSPLVLGLKSLNKTKGDSIKVSFAYGKETVLPQPLLNSANSLEDNKGSGKVLNNYIPTSESRNLDNGDDHNGHPNSKSFEQELFLSSDINAIIEHTDRVVYLEDEDVLHIDSNGDIQLYTNEERDENSCSIRTETKLEIQLRSIDKAPYDHFMLKEIFEQEESVLNTMRGRINFEDSVVTLSGLRSHIESINRSKRLVLIACGTSYNSALVERQLIEEITDLSASVEFASNFLDRKATIFRDDVCVFVSQSGETADTLQALKYCKKKGALCVGIVNTPGSSIARLTDCGVHLNAGPEIGVASTKSFTSQIIVLILLAMQLGQDRLSTLDMRVKISNELKDLSSKIQKTLSMAPQIKALSEKLKNAKNLLIIGRGYQFGTSLEGALKIKEISYIHAEGINSGELKHGPLALVEPSTTMIMIVTKDTLYPKSFSALQQVLARQGRPIVICTEGDDSIPKLVQDVIQVPYVIDCLQPIINTIPLQLLAYYIATLKKLNVDRPRNLAKSVTVE